MTNDVVIAVVVACVIVTILGVFRWIWFKPRDRYLREHGTLIRGVRCESSVLFGWGRGQVDVVLFDGGLFVPGGSDEFAELYVRPGTKLEIPRAQSVEIARHEVSEDAIQLWTLGPYSSRWVKLDRLSPADVRNIARRLGLG